MKVKELIDILEKADPNLYIVCPDQENLSYTKDVTVEIRKDCVEIQGWLPE